MRGDCYGTQIYTGSPLASVLLIIMITGFWLVLSIPTRPIILWVIIDDISSSLHLMQLVSIAALLLRYPLLRLLRLLNHVPAHFTLFIFI